MGGLSAYCVQVFFTSILILILTLNLPGRTVSPTFIEEEAKSSQSHS